MDEYLSDEERQGIEEESKKRALMISRISDIIETEGFNEVVNLLLDISNFNGNNYTSDTSLLSYMEGRRSVFHDVLNVLEECDASFYPRLLLKRAEEFKDGRRSND